MNNATLTRKVREAIAEVVGDGTEPILMLNIDDLVNAVMPIIDEAKKQAYIAGRMK